MKLRMTKNSKYYLLRLDINKDVQLNISLFRIVYFFKTRKLSFFSFSFFSETIKDVQVTELMLPMIYIQLITPIPLIWVTQDKLFNFALTVLRNRAGDIDDNLASYLLGDNQTINNDELIEGQVLYSILSFYGGKKND